MYVLITRDSTLQETCYVSTNSGLNYDKHCYNDKFNVNKKSFAAVKMWFYRYEQIIYGVNSV